MTSSADKQGGINYTTIHDEAVALLPHAANSEQFLVHLKSAMQRVALDTARSSCPDIEAIRNKVSLLGAVISATNPPGLAWVSVRQQYDELVAMLKNPPKVNDLKDALARYVHAHGTYLLSPLPEFDPINAAGQEVETGGVSSHGPGPQAVTDEESTVPAPAAPSTPQPVQTHSKTEYRRLKAQGVDAVPPESGRIMGEEHAALAATEKAGSTPAQSQRSGETGGRFDSGVVDSGEPKARPASVVSESAESDPQSIALSAITPSIPNWNGKVPADPAKAMGKLFSKVDAEDMDTLNWLFASVRQTATESALSSTTEPEGYPGIAADCETMREALQQIARDRELYPRTAEEIAAKALRDIAPLSSSAATEAVTLAEQWKGRADDCGRLARAVLDAPLSSTAPIIGYAVRMQDGPFVGIWPDRATAEHVRSKQPPSHNDVVIPVCEAPLSATEAQEARMGGISGANQQNGSDR